MATSLFFMPTDKNSGEIRTEPVQKSRGRKPGSKRGQQNQIKKPRLRGMGVAQLERYRVEDEMKKLVGGGDTSSAVSDLTRLSGSEPVVVLQGFPRYAAPPTNVNRRFYCGAGGGGVGSGQIVVDPVYGFVETSSELSSNPNPHQACDTCFKKKRFDGEHSVVGSNGSGFSKYMIPPMMMNGYDHVLPPDNQRSYGFYYNDHRIARSDASSASFNDAASRTGSNEEFGGYMEGNPRNDESGGVKEYEFFPGKYDNFPGKYGKRASSVVGDSSPTSSTIDLSLKL